MNTGDPRPDALVLTVVVAAFIASTNSVCDAYTEHHIIHMRDVRNQVDIPLASLDSARHAERFEPGISRSRIYACNEHQVLYHTGTPIARDIFENESLDVVGDGMKRSGLRSNAKTNDAEKTEDMSALQSMQKPIRSELRVVGTHLPKPSRDLPPSIFPKLRLRSVIKITMTSN